MTRQLILAIAESAESLEQQLKTSYVVPGGRFREVYYWDSYFTMLGLQQSGHRALMQHMVDNFAALINTFGYVPNGNRSYYLGRSQPPVFALMVGLLAELGGAAVWARYLPQMQREYQFWMDGDGPLLHTQSSHRRVVRMPDGSRLNRYWDAQATPRPEAYREDVELARHSAQPPAQTWRHVRAAAESGWDFSSRWLADPNDLGTIRTTDIVPVDLNCLLWQLEKHLAQAHRFNADSVSAAVFEAAAERRHKAIHQWFFNSSEGFYFDWDLPAGQPMPHATLAAVFPLFFGLAPAAAAAAVVQRLEDQFLHPGGLATTLHRSGQQWDAPNGWAPLQWLAYCGLRRYHAQRVATELRSRWLATCERVYQATGKMMEKYDVVDTQRPGGGGEYPNQDGFGWTNGVFLALLAAEPQAPG